jgi:hypothetical protein
LRKWNLAPAKEFAGFSMKQTGTAAAAFLHLLE